MIYYFREIDHRLQVAKNPAIERNQGIVVKIHFLRTVACLCACLTLSQISFASDAGPRSDSIFTLSGFGTIGLARSSQDGAEYVRDLSQPRGLTKDWTGKLDSVLGVQANLKLGRDTEGVAQVVSRYRYDGSFRPEVTWAFLSHEFSPGLQARIGRLGTEFYMFADSRLIGYANTTVRPPPDFFDSLIFSHFDGADVSASANLGPGLVRGKLFAGRSAETSPFYKTITWDLSGSKLYGGYADYFIGPWQFRVGRMIVKFSDTELPLNALATFDILSFQPSLSTIDRPVTFDSLGAVYDKGPLRVQAMLGRLNHESKAYESSRAGFVLASYRVGEFTPYLGYSAVKSSSRSFSGLFANVATGLTASTHSDQHTVTIGTRWDFRQNMALKAQLDLVRGEPESIFPFRSPGIPQWNGRMNVLSVALDFAF